ncbi:hypothetical protein E1B28_005536 [Marasmius oreades]|uniref:Uncharacterized protein n=1 Tax=Marasmius oreades TaxID=181124 RepID=A0A9P7S4R5_9AGAR|nr:uncharacterized protein E1B28_005536 [Marasmius oreades]KAG7094716.1 hypothetical protein E1B28_005536 [Marasmius oreades]
MASYLHPFKYLDDFAKESFHNEDPDYCTLHEIAWKNKDRTALFENVVGSESYKSLKLIVPLVGGKQRRLLVTTEYKTALSDANLWFNGQEVPRTTFTQDESYWMPAVHEDPKMDSDDKGEDLHMGTDKGPDWPTSSEPQGVFIVCGIPGIGKSCFLYYVLVERLLANLPTCFQTHPNDFTYWCDKGVFQCTMERVRLGFVIPSDVWFLVDSNQKVKAPRAGILNTYARVIQAASPRKDRLDWARKENQQPYTWIMKPSPLPELLIMRHFWAPKPTVEEVTEFVANYGPSARIIIGFARQPNRYRAILKEITAGMTLEKLEQLSKSLHRLDAVDEAISHRILGIYPGEERIDRTLGFHTSEIYRLVKEAFGRSWDAQRMFAMFNSVGQTRGTAGHLLEDVTGR